MKSQAQNAFVDRLLKNDSETINHMRVQVEALMNHPGWGFVQDLIEARISDMQLLMESGLHQHPEYTAFIGEIRGMRVSRYAAEAVIEAADRRAEQDRRLVAAMEADNG